MSTLHFRQFEVPEGTIDLGLGQPDPSVYPRELLRRAAAEVLAPGREPEGGYEFLQYGAEYGDRSHRIAVARYLTSAYGCPVDPEHVLTTNGNSQGLDLVCTVLARPGDVVIVEEPTYFLARGIFTDHGLTAVGVPSDEHGLDLDALAECLVDLRRNGTPARFVYCIPASQNPTGATMSGDRRLRLLELADEHDLLVVADEVYHLLHYAADPPPLPFSAHVASGRVVSLGTFSKILSPGLRLGWIHADAALLARLVGSGVITSGGGLNPFTSALVTSIIDTGALAENVEHLRHVYTARLAALLDALHQQMPAGVTWHEPAGGYFVWVTLPDGIDAAEVRRLGRTEEVDIRQGRLFSTSGGLTSHLRLSFAHYAEPDLREGVSRLTRAIGRAASHPTVGSP